MDINIREKKYGDKISLRGIQMSVYMGQMLGLFGTSGAGKSTLTKTITGRTKFDGIIRDYDREDMGYIPQFPALNEMETPEEALFWSAEFSNKYRSRRECSESAQFYINMMGLSSVKDHQIKKLSGGQRQRVSIAKELIRKKQILIADEIDTGLDCGVSRVIIRKLKEITHSENKKTIIISHNMSNIELYDRVAILVKDSSGVGRIAYFGSPANMKVFFGVEDYVDIMVKLNMRDEGGEGEADYYIEKFERRRGEIL